MTQVKPLLSNLFNSVMDTINIQDLGLLFNLETESKLSTYLSGRTAQATKTSLGQTFHKVGLQLRMWDGWEGGH